MTTQGDGSQTTEGNGSQSSSNSETSLHNVDLDEVDGKEKGAVSIPKSKVNVLQYPYPGYAILHNPES